MRKSHKDHPLSPGYRFIAADVVSVQGSKNLCNLLFPPKQYRELCTFCRQNENPKGIMSSLVSSQARRCDDHAPNYYRALCRFRDVVSSLPIYMQELCSLPNLSRNQPLIIRHTISFPSGIQHSALTWQNGSSNPVYPFPHGLPFSHHPPRHPYARQLWLSFKTSRCRHAPNPARDSSLTLFNCYRSSVG